MLIIALILLIIIAGLFFILSFVGVNFNKEFWIDMVKNSIPSIFALFLTVFVIDFLYKKRQKEELIRLNKDKAETISFLSNRMAFYILKYLDLMNEKEVRLDIDNQFKNAISKLSSFKEGIDNIFLKKLIGSKDKQQFINHFIKIVEDEHKNIQKIVKEIYPHANLELQEALRNLGIEASVISKVLGIIIQGIREVQKRDIKKNSGSLTQQQMDMLIELVFVEMNSEIKNMADNIIRISNIAQKGHIFTQI